MLGWGTGPSQTAPRKVLIQPTFDMNTDLSTKLDSTAETVSGLRQEVHGVRVKLKVNTDLWSNLNNSIGTDCRNY